jgi:hypothetical protein
LSKHDRESLAKRYSFETYAELLAASFKLPNGPGEVIESYVAKHRNGYWFVWQTVSDIKESKSSELFVSDVQSPG